jgi:catecholate siderophore receptor
VRRFLLSTAFLCSAIPLFAQPAPGFVVRGTVLDSMRAPIAGARVLTTNEATVQGPSTVTNERGEFTMALPPGTHTITVQVAGFRDASLRLIASESGAESREFVMEVAGLTDAVTVKAPAGYQAPIVSSATKTVTPLRDVPQAITVVTQELIQDQLMMSVGDVVKYVPGITQHQGENNRDQLVIRGNSTSADFFVNGVRDDVQYYRDLYNLDRVEALKGPNAMIFGRGGAGGVVNRVTKEAVFQPLHNVTLQAGAFDNRRFTLDVGQPLTGTVAIRLNGMYEDSDSFRSFVGLKRYGVNPTVTIAPSSRTRISIGYEYLNDTRVADRGITSFQGRPATVDPSTYYGNPDASHVAAYVNVGSVEIQHQAGAVLVRNHTVVGNYDRSYQNFVPGAASADQTLVALTAYNNATNRTNLFNQTDVTFSATTGRFRHTLLAGAEIGRQLTDNFRNTGYFNNTVTSIQVPFANPTISTPVTFRQSATDADNHVRTSVGAAYAQDQVELTRHVQVIGGLRFDRFDVEYHNNRNGDTLTRPDDLVSPRAGLVIKPVAALSLYTSHSVSYLPSSGDQFSSLTVITQQLEPEKFNNYEVGLKWEARSDLSLTTAVYRLDRTNTRSTDPNDPTRIVQTGSQRTNGYEVGLNGHVSRAWQVAGGYAYQDAFVTSATTAAPAGAVVGQVPHHTFSLWNHYQVHPRLAGGLGLIYRSDMFATIDNTVMLPGYVRADAAVFLNLSRDLRVQVNAENLFDKHYFVNADSNTNISPGFPRAVRVGLTASF